MKTAIQWLEQQIKEKMGLDGHDTNQLKYFINKALEKEKEQIMNAFDMGNTTIKFVEEAEEYYNQTYNQKQIIIDIMKADEEDGLYNQNK